MTDFYTKLESQNNVHHMTLSENVMNDPHAHSVVSTVSNRKLNLKNNQLPIADIHRNANWWRYNSKSDLSTMISNAGQAHIQLERGSGSGHVKAAWLRFNITNNTGNTVDLVNMAHLIQEIEFQTPAGQQIQLLNGTELWNLICRFYSKDEFPRIARLINTNENFGKGKTLANGASKQYWLPLLGNFLESSQFLISSVDGDLNCYVRFRQSSATVVSGSAPTLTELSLDVQMEQMDSRKRSSYIQRYRSKPHHYFFPFTRRQTITQTLAASTTYNLNLSAIKGDVVWIDFIIRESISGSALRNYAPISTFRYLNNEGDELTGQNLIYSDFNKYVMQHNYFPSNFSENNNIYSFVFSIEDSAPMHLVMNAQKLGSYPFTTYERLEFTTTAAGVNEVQQIAPQGTPASGSIRIGWQTPYGIEYTGTLAYNASAAVLKAAVEALSTFEGTVTFSGVLTSSQTATFGGNYGYRPMLANGYQFIVEPLNALTAGSAVVFYTTASSVAGVEGFNNAASHTIDIIAYTTSLLELAPNGSIMVKNN